MKYYKVRITLLDPMLGTAPANKEIFATYIASKRPEGPAQDELGSADSAEIQGTTGFHKVDGAPHLYDYQIRGFFKESCTAMRLVEDSNSRHIVSYKQKVDLLFFVYPRKIMISIPEGQHMDVCERPLRAMTMQGERVALARSEQVPSDSTLEFWLKVMSDDIVDKNKEKISTRDLLCEWLDYGVDHGLGQWRNSGKGRFFYTIEEVGKIPLEAVIGRPVEQAK
jgi:hypothetical protein